MKTNIDRLKNRCEIWVPYEERATYRTTGEYKTLLASCKKDRLTPCVFIGGQQPLLPTISNLLDEQKPEHFF